MGLPDGEVVHRPVLYARMGTLPAAEEYILDSGADVTLAPKRFADLLGLSWSAGREVRLKGISPRPECAVWGRMMTVHIEVESPGWTVQAPVVFAEGDAPLLAGRRGFLDRFVITLDGEHKTTRLAFRG